MDAFAMFLGYTIMYGVLFCSIFLFIVAGWEHTEHPSDFYSIYTWWDFGVIIAHKEHMAEKIRKTKKAPASGIEVKSGWLFINAPKWFNQHVYNFGKAK